MAHYRIETLIRRENDIMDLISIEGIDKLDILISKIIYYMNPFENEIFSDGYTFAIYQFDNLILKLIYDGNQKRFVCEDGNIPGLTDILNIIKPQLTNMLDDIGSKLNKSIETRIQEFSRKIQYQQVWVSPNRKTIIHVKSSVAIISGIAKFVADVIDLDGLECHSTIKEVTARYLYENNFYLPITNTK